MNSLLKCFFMALSLSLFLTLMNSNTYVVYAQENESSSSYDDDDDDIPERLRFYKEQYEETYNYTFEIVWSAIKQAIEDNDCLLEQESSPRQVEGLYRGVMKSNMCVFVESSDSTVRLLHHYSYHVPTIYGAKWINGRIQYKFNIREQEDGSCKIVLKTEMSGFEDKVTSQVHFWKSNGLLEMAILERIKNILEEQN
ncbi:MAG: hypothetical protein GX121_04660 [Ignavibacteria bacterium]|nr:hypothetical protein [Ignavibacteria bacterium]